MSSRRPCKACGTPLHFVRTMEGKLMPLDEKAPVFVIHEDAEGEPIAVRKHEAWVSHFATCPKAGDFSKGGGHG